MYDGTRYSVSNTGSIYKVCLTRLNAWEIKQWPWVDHVFGTCHCLLTVLSWTCTTKLVPIVQRKGHLLGCHSWTEVVIQLVLHGGWQKCVATWAKNFHGNYVTEIWLVSLDLSPCCVEFEFLSSLFSFLNNSVTHKTSRATCFIAELLTGTITYTREQHLHELQHNNWKINR